MTERITTIKPGKQEGEGRGILSMHINTGGIIYIYRGCSENEASLFSGARYQEKRQLARTGTSDTSSCWQKMQAGLPQWLSFRYFPLPAMSIYEAM